MSKRKCLISKEWPIDRDSTESAQDTNTLGTKVAQVSIVKPVKCGFALYT